MMVRNMTLVVALILAACAGRPPPSPPPVADAGPVAPAPPAVVKAFPVDEAPAPEATPIVPEPGVPGGAPRLGLLGATAGGAQVYLSDFRGKVVVANFWASWCPPCWGDMPRLEALRRDYSGSDLVILAVNHRENPDAIIEFVRSQEVPLGFPVLSDLLGIATRDRGVVTFPSTLLFDRRGQLSRRFTGMFGADMGALRMDIDRLLRATAPSG